ncbi:MAG: hypothetical protein NZ518_10755, partial [Dehalococcoidia bacterium]|nr:hypothetical protein [Dehalococcoidia bacterium]
MSIGEQTRAHRFAGASAIDIGALVLGEHSSPRTVLGPHQLPDGQWVVRAFLPDAVAAQIVLSGASAPIPGDRAHPSGLFVWRLGAERPERYELVITDTDGTERRTADPYAFPLQLGDLDIHLFNEGSHRQAYNHLGAHVRVLDGVIGTQFAV